MAVRDLGDSDGYYEEFVSAFKLGVVGSMDEEQNIHLNNVDFWLVAWFVLTIAAIFQILIMLNILIAIIVTTYQGFQKDIDCHEYRERCALMGEVESMLHWKQKEGQAKYIQLAFYKDKEAPTLSQEQSQEANFKAMNKRMDFLEANM